MDRELARIRERLEALRAKTKELGDEHQRLLGSLDEAAAQLSQAAADLAEAKAKAADKQSRAK